MPTIADLAKSRFLKKEDIGAGKLLTITRWTEENVAMQGQPEDWKYCLHFQELEKPLVLNSTNGQLIAQICGNDDFDNWTGKRIVLYTDPNIILNNKLVGGIRARAPKIAAAAPAAYAPTTPKPTPGPKPRPQPAPAPVIEAAEAEEVTADDDVPF